MGCGSSVPAMPPPASPAVVKSNLPQPPTVEVPDGGNFASPRTPVSFAADGVEFEAAVAEVFGAIIDSKKEPTTTPSARESNNFSERRGSRAVTDEQMAALAAASQQVTDAFGSLASPRFEGKNDDDVEEEKEAGDMSMFRKRRLSKEFQLVDLAKASDESQLQQSKPGATGETLLQPEAAAELGEQVDVRSARAATAATAAARAAVASGKMLLVAKEMEDTREGSFGASPSFRGSPSKKALDSLTSGDHVGTFSRHGIEPAPGKDERGSVAKINQDCACIAHPINGDRNAALL